MYATSMLMNLRDALNNWSEVVSAAQRRIGEVLV